MTTEDFKPSDLAKQIYYKLQGHNRITFLSFQFNYVSFRPLILFDIFALTLSARGPSKTVHARKEFNYL